MAEEIKKEQEVQETKEEKKDVSKMTPEEIDKLKYQDKQEKEQVINKVIKGVNDTWEKSITLKN